MLCVVRNRESRAAKLQDAGIWPEAVPRKMSGRKRNLPQPVRNCHQEQPTISMRDCLLATRHAAACVRRIPSNLINYVAVRLFMEAHLGSQLHAEIFDYVPT